MRHFSDLYAADAQAREVARGSGRVTALSFFLAFVGFALLVILHELGHFTAAKAVGMRVEKFSLFFPPTLWSKKVGETEYAIGSIPAGGYVKISGMNPDEDLPEEVRDRAYHAQPVWKRIVVIAAGPAVNLVLAFVLLFVFFVADRAARPARATSARSRRATRPQGVLKPGDRLVAVDGAAGDADRALEADRQPQVRRRSRRRRAARPPSPSTLTVKRDGACAPSRSRPIYDPVAEAHAARLRATRPGPREDLGARRGAST